MSSSAIRVLGLAVMLAPVMAFAAPEMLVAQVHPKGDKVGAKVPIYLQVAERFDREGRVIGMPFSMVNPVIRAAVSERKISFSEDPTVDDVRKAMENLGVAYALVITAEAKGMQVDATATLFRRGNSRPVWTDKTNLGVMIGEKLDELAVADSLARTWQEKLAQGPFKDLQPRVKIQTPEPLPGDPTTDNTVPIPNKPPDTKKAREDGLRLVQEGKVARGLELLRDVVDSAPMEIEARLALIRGLEKAGLMAEASAEAANASDLFPARVDLWIASAQMYRNNGDADKARNALNEALARDPKDADALLMSGWLALDKGNIEIALRDFGASITTKDRAEARIGRGLASALSGLTAQAQSDVEAAKKLGFSFDQSGNLELYRSITRSLDELATGIAYDVRTLIQRARVRRKDPDVADTRSLLEKRDDALRVFLQTLGAPAVHEKSHARRLLALSLLSQALADIRIYIDDGKEDILTEATLQLGEALRQLTALKQAVQDETVKR